ncbi:unnamed protein product [Lepeophtheirus salmonis]|uniref:(salmon louse) hypothetical protein n=1 Tax=Lepeophtheirus salmonis TaxID=72036 RepID=A0A7R8D937_LEPSM|nr:unnamed protein product [Lepeophtheirus salmonis]CAF3041519.1 unnamed protein product [Lepeophtheirus salmonis]
MSLVGSPISSPPGTSYDHGRRVSGASIASLTLPRNTSTYTSYYIQPEEGNLSREEMTEMYHALIKRETGASIKWTFLVEKTESNPEHLKEEYSNLLQKMVSLNDKKMKENTELGLELEAIAMKKHEMDEEVSRLNKEIHQKHAKAVHIITEKMRPHRLEMIKLQEKLQWLERRYKEVCQMSKENSEMKDTYVLDDEGDERNDFFILDEDHHSFNEVFKTKGDTLELALENQVYADRMDRYKNNKTLAKVKMEKQLVSITHLKMKINEIMMENESLLREKEISFSEIEKMKKEYKGIAKELNQNINLKLELEEKN